MTIPVLETERLRLRPFSAEDDVAVFALASDPEVARFVRFEAHRNIEATRAFLEMVERHVDYAGLPAVQATFMELLERTFGALLQLIGAG